RGESRCLLCQRVDPPFERAVAYGSYDGELRDLIHLLKFQQVRPAAAVLGRVLAGTIANLARVMPVGMIAGARGGGGVGGGRGAGMAAGRGGGGRVVGGGMGPGGGAGGGGALVG